MSYGIKVVANNGSELIDGTYSAYSMILSGTAYVNGTGRVNYGFHVDLPINYDQKRAVIAIRPPYNEPVCVHGATLITKNKVSVPYRVFYPQLYIGPSSEKYGARVWDGNGGLVFDSGDTTFDILSTHLPNFPIPSRSVTVNNPGDKWIVTGTGGLRYSAPGPIGHHDVGGFGYVIRRGGYIEGKILETISLPGGFSGEGSRMHCRQFSLMRVEIV